MTTTLTIENLEKFFIAYDKVFDEHGNIRACGQKACINLIFACRKLEPTGNFGNVHTGFLNIPNVQDLHYLVCQFRDNL